MKKALSSRGCPKVVLSQRLKKTPLNFNAHPGRSNDANRPSSTGETRHKAQSPRGARDSLTFPSGRRIKTPDLPSAARQRPSQTSPSTLPKLPTGEFRAYAASPQAGATYSVTAQHAVRGRRPALWSCAPPPCPAFPSSLRPSVPRPRVRKICGDISEAPHLGPCGRKTRVVFSSVGL